MHREEGQDDDGPGDRHGFWRRNTSRETAVEQPFFAGVIGIFGHGNVTGIGQALEELDRLRYYQPRNEQAGVHIAAGLREGEKPPADLCLHLVCGAGSDQHGDGSGGGDDQPLARPPLAGRYLCQPAAPSRACSSWSIP